MSDRRAEHVAELEGAGLSPPDEATLHFLWQIVDEGVLGASRHVELGNQLLLHLIESTPSRDEGLQRARMAADFIARTRGRDTPVIGNALKRLLAGLDDVPAAGQPELLSERIRTWNKASAKRKAHLVKAAVRQLSDARRIMTFDYSSTVAAIAIELARVSPSVVFVVPESRTIAGGARYLREFVAENLTVRYIPDAAIDHALDSCDAALFGVETLLADGSFLNTIGSRMIARLAALARIDVYGCTDFMKLDLRSYEGYRPALADRSYDDILLTGEALIGRGVVDTSAPELEVVPANLTSAILSEYGLVPPAAVWSLGRQVFGFEGGLQ
ncbi:hypothetical protein [Salipiger sp.]|uniref:hypothetical protein n=1 Tax=Salipiger sp. TaxID=2078585 RepID=UPI003A984864